MRMTKREVISSMVTLLIESDDKQEKMIKSGEAKSALDIHNSHKEAMSSALKIAEENGYTGGCKWQLWDAAVSAHARKLGVSE